MKKYDCIVVGGGFAGVSAAISAARQNKSVLLVERANCLGGTATVGLVEPFMPVYTKIGEERVLLCRGLFKEIFDRLNENPDLKVKAEKITDNTLLDDEYLRVMLNRMALESGVELLFHACLAEVVIENARIESIKVAVKSGLLELCADCYIDATGDADLAMLAGCPYRLGRESDGLCQPMTLSFRLTNVDMERFEADQHRVVPLYKKLQAEGKIKNPKEDVQIFRNSIENVLHFNSTRILRMNPTDPFELTRAEIEAREQVYELYEFMKSNIDGCQNCRISKTGAAIGVRESRMIGGEYILTGEDLTSCRQFDDRIALANYDLDLHDPTGGGVSHHFFKAGEYYSIPYRSLVAKGVDNLAVAGRCISTTHEAQASIRIMPIVCCLGEAAGIAAAVAVESKSPFRDADIREIQLRLREAGALLEL